MSDPLPASVQAMLDRFAAAAETRTPGLAPGSIVSGHIIITPVDGFEKDKTPEQQAAEFLEKQRAADREIYRQYECTLRKTANEYATKLRPWEVFADDHISQELEENLPNMVKDIKEDYMKTLFGPNMFAGHMVAKAFGHLEGFQDEED